MAGNSYKDLIVWQKAMDLAVEVYALSKRFPTDERFRIVDQLTRAVASVPANIAEGHGRDSKNDFSRFLSISRGSPLEVETFLLAIRLEFLGDAEVRKSLGLIVEIGKILTALKKRLRDTS